jgi:aminoglycoside N3'-acetyltransferase
MDISLQLLDVGVRPGGILLVHVAFSKVRSGALTPVDLIHALRQTLGPDGTLVMPSMSDDDDHPFDAGGTPCRGMGIVADTFWRLPGVMRSDSPHAFAAMGPNAPEITAPHPVDVPHGVVSPVGRVWQRDGQVLLLGIGHDANTTIHLAENMAGVRYGCEKYAIVRAPRSSPTADADGVRRVDYFEIDHCCARFALMDDWLDRKSLQRRGRVAGGDSRLMRSQDLVAEALVQLQADQTVFLHQPGECDECDLGRSGMMRQVQRLQDSQFKTRGPKVE